MQALRRWASGPSRTVNVGYCQLGNGTLAAYWLAISSVRAVTCGWSARVEVPWSALAEDPDADEGAGEERTGNFVLTMGASEAEGGTDEGSEGEDAGPPPLPTTVAYCHILLRTVVPTRCRT